LAGAPEGTLERYVGARMATIGTDGEDAAGIVRWSLRHFETARFLARNRYDLRWDES